MESRPFRAFLSLNVLSWRMLALALILVLGVATVRQTSTSDTPKLPDPLPAAEFTRIIQSFSESDGYFFSDNLISNETSYLTILDKLRELGASGGAYIGVGPDQNYTYIAKIHPEIAFIIDIRRQAMIQHLMYKAIFQLSDNRVQFLSRLFSRPLTEENQPASDASASELMDYFSGIIAREQAFAANIDQIEKTIREDFMFPLSKGDRSSLEYVYGNFYREGLGIAFRFGNYGRYSFRRGRFGRFPSMRDLIEQPDPHGNPGNYLASREDYEFIRDLHRRNRIIPLVGDFAGEKALRAIGTYLRKNSYLVTAFYTSNVEQYLFQDGLFGHFADNVKTLPISSKSVFIRSVTDTWRMHPATAVGGRTITLLQMMPVFLEDYEKGLYSDYWSLVSTHYIAPDQR